MKNSYLTLLFIFFLCSSSYAQYRISGKVTGVTHESIPYVNVIVQKDSVTGIIAHTTTNGNGEYTIELSQHGIFQFSFSILGYASKTISVHLIQTPQQLIRNITLEEKPLTLNEVIVHAQKPIKVKKDTIVISASKFLKGDEDVVEDLLKKIPGLNVDSEGTIKIGNKEIEKVMVDGDDFFERGYKILTKNMPPDPIAKIEILQRYSNNKLLKGVEESDKVALNLVLKEDARRVWFGNVDFGYGITSKDRYQLQGNLMNFGKNAKYYFLSNLNNIGYDATGNLEHLTHTSLSNGNTSIGDQERAHQLIHKEMFVPGFKKSRTLFNNAELVSLNGIFKISKKAKVRALTLFNTDENDFFKNAIEIVDLKPTAFVNTEIFQARDRNKTLFGKIDFINDLSKNSTLETVTKYNYQKTSNHNTVIFNRKRIIENLQSRNHLFDQKINYTQKLKKHKVLLFTGRYIYEEIPQNYQTNQFIFQSLFPNVSGNNVHQSSGNLMQYAGMEVHLLDRKKRQDLLEIKFGSNHRKDRLQTQFFIKQNATTTATPTNFQNLTHLHTNELYAKAKYHYKYHNLTVIGQLNMHQFFNSLQLENNSTSQHPFFINPSLGIEWKINATNRLRTSYGFRQSNIKILDIYNRYLLTGFRSFSKGIGSFSQLGKSMFSLNYELGNWSDRFFGNLFLNYSKDHDYFSTNTLLQQQYTLSQKILVKDRETIQLNTNVNRFLQMIYTNLKLVFSLSQITYENSVNTTNNRQVRLNTYNYGIELRSGFSGFFNYHLGTKWVHNQVKTTTKNSFTNRISFLDLRFDFSKQLHFNFMIENYFFGIVNSPSKHYYFADFHLTFKPKNKSYSFALVGKNLANTQKFKEFFISDIGNTTTEYRLLPRYVLLKIKYRF